MTVILIEGSDGTGKSTLADAILELAEDMAHGVGGYQRIRGMHYGVPKYDPTSPLTIGEQAMNQLMVPLEDYDITKDLVILDRFHWGEPVYAPIFRPNLCIDPLFGTLRQPEFMHVERWLQSVGAVNVFVDAPTDVVMERLGIRGEEELLDGDLSKRREQVITIRERYDNLIKYITADARRHPTTVQHHVFKEPDDTRIAAKLILASAIKQGENALQILRDHFQGDENAVIEAGRPPIYKEN